MVTRLASIFRLHLLIRLELFVDVLIHVLVPFELFFLLLTYSAVHEVITHLGSNDGSRCKC